MASQPAPDPEGIKQAQRQEWATAAPGWQRWDTQMTAWSAPATALLVATAQVTSGMQVLDIGSGTGVPALPLAELVGPTGHVTATDLSPEMLAVAEAKARDRGLRNISFQPADAEQLPCPDGQLDLVTGRFSLMFCPNPGRVLAEVYRVLKPGGRTVLMVWGPMNQNAYFGSITAPFARRGLLPAPPPGTPGLGQFSQPGRLAAALQAAGFAQVKEETHQLVLAWPAAVEAWSRSISDMSPTFKGLMSSLPAEQLEAVLSEMQAAAQQYADEQHIKFPVAVNVAFATHAAAG